MKNGPKRETLIGAILTFLLIFASPYESQSQNQLLLGADLGGAGLSHVGGNSPALSPEINVTWQFSDAWGVTASGSMAEFTVIFDTPGSTGSLPVQTWWLEAGAVHRIFSIANAMDVSGTVGGGVTSMHRAEEQVPLGGLGSATIPAATDTRGHLLTGIRLTREIADPVRLHVGTNVRFISPFSSPETGYSVYGGFSIEVL